MNFDNFRFYQEYSCHFGPDPDIRQNKAMSWCMFFSSFHGKIENHFVFFVQNAIRKCVWGMKQADNISYHRMVATQ